MQPGNSKMKLSKKKKKRQATSTEETERNILEQIMEYIQQDANTPEA